MQVMLHSVPPAGGTAALMQQATIEPCLWLETPGHSLESLGQSLVGSLLLSPGSWCTQCSVCALQESISQSCVSSGSSLLGLMATSSKRAYAIPKSAASRAPTPAAVHSWPVPPQETLRRSSVSVSVGSLGPSVHKVCLCSQCLWWKWGLILNWNSPLLLSCWASPLPLSLAAATAAA